MSFFIVLVVLGIAGFGIFAIRAARENEDAPAPRPSGGAHPRDGEPRDIPPLFPDFFHGVLFGVGKEATSQNLLALCEYVSQMISVNAYGWFHQSGDVAAEARFSRRFRGGGGPEQAIERVPDDMIDFLWDWHVRAHDPLREWIPRLHGDLTAPSSRLWRYGPDLPFGMWEDDD